MNQRDLVTYIGNLLDISMEKLIYQREPLPFYQQICSDRLLIMTFSSQQKRAP
jgi:hypothetical protein